MMKRALLAALFSIALMCLTAHAQNVCPNGTKSDNLVCLIPQVYGINGLNVANPSASGQFTSDFLTSSLSPVQTSIARESALLPLASPSSGITFSWDAAAKVFTSSTDSLGPIIGDRAETIGKARVFLGFAYQNFKFDRLDGVNLQKLPVLLTQPDDPNTFAGHPTCSVNIPAGNPTLPDGTPQFSNTLDSVSGNNCSYIRDVIATTNSVDLKIHQFTTFITFGLTNRIDVSAAIPIENVRMAVVSTAVIVHNDVPNEFFHVFPPTSTCGAPCFSSTFSNPGTASGLGDITLRVKGVAWKGEKAALGLGVDVRLPTGEQLNFLGSGAAGVRPFVVWSYRSRLSPHIVVGYQANGSSQIAGNLSTGKKERLPGELTYATGADVWLTKWFTAAFDIVGQQIFQAQQSTQITTADLGACQNADCSQAAAPKTYSTLTPSTGTFNITNASVGVKFKPFGNLLITGNVLIKLNDGGLRANVVPLVGVSYTF